VNVVLVGYRGTGKSVVARRLGTQLGRPVICLDAEIVRRAGRGIPEIVAERGWGGFRDLEEEVCRDAAAGQRTIIDCGGGVVERENNFRVLRGAGAVFWLSASPQTIIRRIAGDDQRPSLTGDKNFIDEVVEVLERRIPLYRRMAHHEISTDDRGVEQVVSEILRRIQDDSATR
jgi:shikimate kinase